LTNFGEELLDAVAREAAVHLRLAAAFTALLGALRLAIQVLRLIPGMTRKLLLNRSQAR